MGFLNFRKKTTENLKCHFRFSTFWETSPYTSFDYKHLYLGMGYHIEFEIKGSDHTRGLFFRIGATF